MGKSRPRPHEMKADSSRVTKWRLALWQPWRERQMTPAKPQPIRPSQRPPTSIVTFNVNGFHSKKVELDDFLGAEDVAVLALQETLVTARHYPVHMPGYRAYTSNAKEDFRGIAVLVDNWYASYEVPHGVHWMLHVKVFNYAGLTGPVHFINVYLKSGGNHRWTCRDQLTVVKGIVAKILERDGNSKVVVLGDMNEPDKALIHHLNIVGNKRNYLFPAHFVGNRRTHFPVKGEPSAIDNILLTETLQRLFRGARVLCNYNLSDHRPVRMTPYADITAMERAQCPARASFDTKMIYLKGDLIANDNAWTKLMQQAYGEVAVDGDYAPIADNDTKAKVSTFANEFIDTFDKVCCKHNVKRVHQPGSNPEFPKKLKLLQQTVHRYSKRWQKAVDAYRTPDESTCIQLVRAQTHFKKAKKDWQARMRHKFYANVAGDFIANDNKRVWSRLRSQVKPSSVVETVNPVKDSEGVLQYHADRILEVMKAHYQDLLTYDPNGLTSNHEYWADVDLGEERTELKGLNESIEWPEIIFTIRGMNRNTTPGKDEVHINVLKIMVREESMAALKIMNPRFKRPDNLYVDLSRADIEKHLSDPLTHLGKLFHALLRQTWQTGCIPEQWQEVHIINLHKGGDSENTNNYRGISLISCALKVLFCLMANRLSKGCEGNDLLCPEQAGFCPCEEAVAQAIALAEIIWRHFLEGRTTLCTFVDFKKA
jgi:exonuclease III